MDGQRQEICRPNFTLIELLVVLVVIAILMSLLMGALKNARETARTVECMARLRSFHQWQHLYLVDNDMWFVVNRTWGLGLEGPDIPTPESPQHCDTFVNALKTYMGNDWPQPTGAPPPATITFYVQATDTWSILRPLP